MTNEEGLKLLRLPFPRDQISKLPKPTCPTAEWNALPKGKCNECGGWHATSKTIHLDYVGHAALTNRLLDADPLWSWEPLAYDEHGLPRFDPEGGLWIKLTVCGHTRLGYGNAKLNTYADVGSRIKEAIGDALRNAAMRGGGGLDLWHKGDSPLFIGEAGDEEGMEEAKRASADSLRRAAATAPARTPPKEATGHSDQNYPRWAAMLDELGVAPDTMKAVCSDILDQKVTTAKFTTEAKEALERTITAFIENCHAHNVEPVAVMQHYLTVGGASLRQPTKLIRAFKDV